MSRLIVTWVRALGASMVLALLATAGAAQGASGLARLVDGGVKDTRFGRTELTLQLSQGVPWRVFTLTDPLRVVLDFREVDWQGTDPLAFDGSDRVQHVRMGRFRPGWSRLVLLLTEPMEVDTAALAIRPDGQADLRVRLGRTDADSFAAGAGAPDDPHWQDRPELRLTAPPPDDGPFTIVLDPGHGGIDPGAQRGGVTEADLMLQFARELREVLLRAGDYRVELTREADHFVSLEGRVARAHQVGADMFISLHADALEEGVAHGAAVYTLAEDASDAASAALAERHDRDDLLAGIDLSGQEDEVAHVLLQLARLDNTPRSQALARHIVAGIENALGHVHKKPLRQAGFSVLKAADIPSVLVELGFLSTERDLKNLQDSAWRAGMAAGIRDGIAQWQIEDAALARLRRQ